MNDTKNLIYQKPLFQPLLSQSSERVGEEIPPIITKKWLYGRFNISPTNKSQLYTLVLTDNVLQAIDLTVSQVRTCAFRSFNAVQSRKLAEILFQ